MSLLCKRTNEWTGDVPSHNLFFLLSPCYTVLKDTAPGISTSAVYWSRFDGGHWRNDQLPALVCLGPHAFGFHAVATVVGCRVYLVEIMSSGYALKCLFLSSCTQFFFIVRWNFGACRYAGRPAEILAQSAHYAGHGDGNIDFSSLEIRLI